MSSKKAPGNKLAPQRRTFDCTETFARDWERLSRSGHDDMKRLKAAMLLLIANDAALGPEWLDHALKGDWAAHRECHIAGDFLLIYQPAASGERLVFVRAGSHADLFE